MENDGKLRKREYTLLLKHNMSNISKMQWWMPLISSHPNADSKGQYDAHCKVRQHRADLQLIWYTEYHWKFNCWVFWVFWICLLWLFFFWLLPDSWISHEMWTISHKNLHALALLIGSRHLQPQENIYIQRNNCVRKYFQSKYISTKNSGSRQEKYFLGCVTHQNVTLVVKIYFVKVKIYRPNIYKI